MKTTWVTKYGYPESRRPIEHEDDECAACAAAGSIPEDSVVFIVVEKDDGTTIVRRVVGLGTKQGFFWNGEYGFGWVRDPTPMAGCKIVGAEDVDREIAEAKASGWYHYEPDESKDGSK